MASNKKTIVLGLDYSEFEGGISAVNRKMALLDQEFKLASEMVQQYGTETDKLGLKHENLTQKINLQNIKLEEAKKKYDAVMSSQDKNTKKADDADKALLKERIALEKLNNELAANKEKLDKIAMSEVDRKMAILQQEFELTTEKTKSFSTETEQLTTKSNMLSDKITLQTQKVELSKKAYEEARTSGEKNEHQLSSLYSAYIQNETALEKLNNELNENNQKIKDGETTSKSFGDTIRNVAGSLGIDVNPAVEALASKFDGVSEATGTAVLALGTVLTTLGKLALNTASHAGEVEELSHKYGLATSTVQELMYAEGYLEISVDQIGSSMQKMTKNMDSARSGTGDAAEAFKKLHVKITESNGQLRDSEQVFYNTIDALGSIKNETEKNALSMAIFGKSAADLNNLILEGSSGMKAYQKEAHEVGAVMSDELVSSAAATDDKIEKLKEKFKATGVTLSTTVLPVIETFADILGAIPTPVLTGIIVFGGLIIIFGTVSKAIAGVTAANTLLSVSNTTVAATGVTAAAGMSPLLIALLAIAAVIAIIVAGVAGMKQAMSSVKDTISDVTEGMGGVMNGASATNDTVNMIKMKSAEYGNTYYAPANTPYTGGKGYAEGTKYHQGGARWVGENGPEIYEFPVGGIVHDNNESALLTGGDTFVFNVQADNIKELNDLIDMANRYRQTVRQGRV